MFVYWYSFIFYLDGFLRYSLVREMQNLGGGGGGNEDASSPDTCRKGSAMGLNA